MKGNPFEQVAAAVVAGAETPVRVSSRRNCGDKRDRQTVDERRGGRRVGLHELAVRFAAAIVAGMAVIGRGSRFVLVSMLMASGRMKVPAANHGQNLRFVATRGGLDMLMMPAATDQPVHEQREGGKAGNQMTHARRVRRIDHQWNAGRVNALPPHYCSFLQPTGYAAATRRMHSQNPPLFRTFSQKSRE
jgi:hypothetical protein